MGRARNRDLELQSPTSLTCHCLEKLGQVCEHSLTILEIVCKFEIIPKLKVKRRKANNMLHLASRSPMEGSGLCPCWGMGNGRGDCGLMLGGKP